MYTEDEQLLIRHDAFRWLDERIGAGEFDFSRAEIRSFNYDGVAVPLADA
jgi:putative restriction endonuclease